MTHRHVRLLSFGLSLLVLGATMPSAWAGKKDKRRRGKVAVEAPAAVPAFGVPLLPVAASPLDPGLVRPALSGAEDGLNITSMQRSRVSFSLGVDHSWLEGVDGAAREAVLAYAAADPRWRVTEEDGTLIALRRVQDANGWMVPRTGYHTGKDATWRVGLRFGAWDGASPWTQSADVSRVGPRDTTIRLKAFVVGMSGTYGQRASALSVDGDHLAFDVYELAKDDDRSHTVKALTGIVDEVGVVLATADYITAQGASAMPLPEGEPADEQRLILRARGAGLLDLRARVNAGTPGWTWVRLLAEGGPWEEAAVGAGTRERVGYSALSHEGFWMQGDFAVPPGDAFAAVAEVWHLPDGGGPVRKIAAFPVSVPAR